jgi:hypothetical protein
MLLKSDFICLNSLGWQKDEFFQWELLLLCSWVTTINPAVISCSELRMEVSFLFGLILQALAQSKVVLFLVIFQQMGTNFAAICLKSLVHHVL